MHFTMPPAIANVYKTRRSYTCRSLALTSTKTFVDNIKLRNVSGRTRCDGDNDCSLLALLKSELSHDATEMRDAHKL